MKLYSIPGLYSLADHIVLKWTGKPFKACELTRNKLNVDFLGIDPHDSTGDGTEVWPTN